METKVCNLCSEEKDIEDFYSRARDDGSSYVVPWCKPCHLYKCREADRKRLYNMNPGEWSDLFRKQNGRCAICKTHQSELNYTLCVDHNHTTGVVRGLLCKKCNQALGMFNDDYENLANALAYLANHRT